MTGLPQRVAEDSARFARELARDVQAAAAAPIGNYRSRLEASASHRAIGIGLGARGGLEPTISDTIRDAAVIAQRVGKNLRASIERSIFDAVARH